MKIQLTMGIHVFLLLILISTQIFANEHPGRILITNMTVFDGLNDNRLLHANVFIEGGLIKKISAEEINAEGARIIDGNGRTLIPGLVDMHWHSAYASIPMQKGLSSDHAYHLLVGAKSNEKTLIRGFTTVRDMGGNVFSLAALTDAGHL